MGRYIHVAGINRGPCVLEHKYHRHWNHGCPRVAFWGILGVLSIEPLLGGGGGPAGGLYRPPPRNENSASHGPAPSLPPQTQNEFPPRSPFSNDPAAKTDPQIPAQDKSYTQNK